MTQRNLGLLASLLFVSGCASSPPANSPPANMPDIQGQSGRLVVERLASLSGMLETVHVMVDGVEVFTLGNGDSSYVDLPAGFHSLLADHWSGSGAASVMDLKPGETVYYQTGWFSTGLAMQGKVMIPTAQFNLAEIKNDNRP